MITRLLNRARSGWTALLNRASTDVPTSDAAGQFSGGRNLTDMLKSANLWREQYNPLKGLDIARAVQLRDDYLRGDMSLVQWTYHFIELSDPDLFALVTRRTSAITKLDWEIKTCTEDRTGFDQSLAEAQAETLKAAYERIDNLAESFAHLALATFRGFAHLEKHGNDLGEIIHLEPLDGWNAIRNGFRGPWKINPSACSNTWTALPEANLIVPDRWLIRTVPRHIDWLGLVKFIRANLSQKDWDGFVEIYGIPGAVVIGPPNIPAGKETEYETAAQSVAEGGSGYLPNGSSIQFSDSSRGVNPFRDHLTWLSEQLILAGTGGNLTMLSQPTGIGQGASGEHANVFRDIAIAEGQEISEVFQKQFDAGILAETFPGKPVLAYFELSSKDETDPGKVVEDAVRLKSAGYRMSAEELSEKTGYKLEIQEDTAPAVPPQPPKPQKHEEPEEPTTALENRAATESLPSLQSLQSLPSADPNAALYRAIARDLQPVRKRLEAILQIQDPDIQRDRLAALQSDLAALAVDINADPESAKSLAAQIARAMQSAPAPAGPSTPQTP